MYSIIDVLKTETVDATARTTRKSDSQSSVLSGAEEQEPQIAGEVILPRPG